MIWREKNRVLPIHQTGFNLPLLSSFYYDKGIYRVAGEITAEIGINNCHHHGHQQRLRLKILPGQQVWNFRHQCIIQKSQLRTTHPRLNVYRRPWRAGRGGQHVTGSDPVCIHAAHWVPLAFGGRHTLSWLHVLRNGSISLGQLDLSGAWILWVFRYFDIFGGSWVRNGESQFSSNNNNNKPRRQRKKKRHKEWVRWA